MKKGFARITACALAAGLTIGTMDLAAFADSLDLTLVGVGLLSVGNTDETGEELIDETSDLEDVQEPETAADDEAPVQETESVPEETGTADEAGTADDAEETWEEETQGVFEASADEAAEDVSGEDWEDVSDETEPAPLDTSMVGTTGIALCSEYINIRASADTSGEVLGKLYNNSAVYIEDVDENGWYKVSSGNVEGYVASQYIAVGAQAETLSEEVGYHVAEVGAEVLNVRSDPSEDSEIITTVTNTQEVEVIEDLGGWLKVAVDSTCYGYVSADYVSTEVQYQVAESIEEEEARLEAEYEAYLAEQARQEAEYEAYLASQEAEYEAYLEEQTYSDEGYYYPEDAVYEESYDSSYSDAQAAADAAYQEYLNAQAAADEATQQADEQLVYDTAAAAQEEYAEYLAAQAAADEAAVGMGDSYAPEAYTDDVYVEENNNYADGGYTDDGYTDDGYADDGYDETYEDTYGEDIYAEEYDEGGSSDTGNASLGQQIANYACQFVGNPYVYGGSSLTGGADCSGFTMAVYSNFGVGLPHSAAAQSGCGTPVDLGNLQPGDLLFYNDGGGIGHVTMYIGNGQVVHASSSTTGIIISDVGYRTPVCARRFV